MASHAVILDRWPSRAALLEDLKAQGVDIGPSAIGNWYWRNEIPTAHWVPLMRAAAKRGVCLTLEDFAGSIEAARA